MANSGSTHEQLHLAVESTIDHTSKTQVDVLKSSIQDVCDTARRAPKCSVSPNMPLSAGDVARKLYGANGDHAKDQLKVAQLEKQWKLESWIYYLGNQALLSLDDSEAQKLDQSIQTSAETTAGSANIFASLAAAAQDDLRAAEYQKHVCQLGNKIFKQNTLDIQLDMSLLVRGGCCAHKDMNAAKGGTLAMSRFWTQNMHLPQPATLFNKDNDATVSLANISEDLSLAEQRAISISEAGAIKLCSLAGAAFNHKDDKKGHQDSHVYWFEAKHHRFHRFPDTSNVRYSSYIDAATELCTFHDAYIEFMEHCRQKKQSGTLNHLEFNVLKGLKCHATLAELISISLYGQAVSKPYMRLVRTATVEGKGLADLSPLHAQVQRHLEAIVANPSLVLGAGALGVSGTLDGSAWDEPEVFAVLRRHELKLPYLTDLFVAFCHGALQTWVRFTEEFSAGGQLSNLTPEQSQRAFMPPTNDANEGALGTWRVWTRRFPRLTLHRFNALNTNRSNKTEAYMDQNFTAEQHTWARAEARRIDSSKKEEARKAQLVAAAIHEAEKNQATQKRREEKQKQDEEKLANIQLVLCEETILKMKVSELNDQLKVHRQLAKDQRSFSSISKLKVAEKRKVVVALALRYMQEQLSSGVSSS